MAFRVDLRCYFKTYVIAEYGGRRGVNANYGWNPSNWATEGPFSADAIFELCDQIGVPWRPLGGPDLRSGDIITLRARTRHFVYADWANGFVKADTNNPNTAGLRIVKVNASLGDTITHGDRVAFSSKTRLPGRSRFEREFKWITAEPDGSRPLVATRQYSVPGAWEIFLFEIEGRGHFI